MQHAKRRDSHLEIDSLWQTCNQCSKAFIGRHFVFFVLPVLCMCLPVHQKIYKCFAKLLETCTCLSHNNDLSTTLRMSQQLHI